LNNWRGRSLVRRRSCSVPFAAAHGVCGAADRNQSIRGRGRGHSRGDQRGARVARGPRRGRGGGRRGGRARRLRQPTPILLHWPDHRASLSPSLSPPPPPCPARQPNRPRAGRWRWARLASKQPASGRFRSLIPAPVLAPPRTARTFRRFRGGRGSRLRRRRRGRACRCRR
jgi:hypothetical protein